MTSEELESRIVEGRADRPKNDGKVRTPQLTRDKLVPRGDFETVRTVDRALTVALLVAKLHSETEEIAGDLTNVEEYGDLISTLISLGNLNGIGLNAMLDAAYAKEKRKGGLSEGNFWIPKEFMGENQW